VTEALQARFGHTFSDDAPLTTALTHRSWAHENGGPDNERLEFLGDAVLQLCSTALLMRRFPDAREGQLSRLRSRVVSTRALAAIGRERQVGELLQLGVGEEATGGRDRDRVLACAVEAILGAVYVDAGHDACLSVVERLIGDRIAKLAEAGDAGWKDPRSLLQEHTQREGRGTPSYEVIETEGPAHALVFSVSVTLDGEVLGQGEGSSKRDACRNAAEAALAGLGVVLP